jgi:hypothetical protein
VEIKALNAKSPGTSSCRPLGSRKPMINDNMEDPEDANTGAEKLGITVPVDQDLQILVNLESQGIEGGEVQLLPQHKLVGGHVVSQRRPVTDAEKLRTVKAAQALSLENPHTVMVMTRAYVYRGFWMVSMLKSPLTRMYILMYFVCCSSYTSKISKICIYHQH